MIGYWYSRRVSVGAKRVIHTAKCGDIHPFFNNNMKYAIQVNMAHGENGVSRIAWQFIKAARNAGHEVLRVFFYHAGVENAFVSTAELGDDMLDWSSLSLTDGVELVYCITAAERRGKSSEAALGGFKAGGLGLWVDACLRADRVIVFG